MLTKENHLETLTFRKRHSKGRSFCFKLNLCDITREFKICLVMPKINFEVL